MPSDAIDLLIARQQGLPDTGLNEASTRLQFINEMLEHVLGWPVESFNPEQYVAGDPNDGSGKKKEWNDYHLKSGDTLRLVVEAKRTGKTFQLPTSKKQRVVQLKQLKDNHGNTLGAALRQAQNYCLKVGTYAFVVTNGIQWIASLAFAPNVEADKISAVVYYDLDDIKSNLQEFIELLSPDGLASQVLMTKAVAGRTLTPPFARKLNDALRPAVPTGKNYLVQPMSVLMDICFGDLTDTDHAAMLEECYVSSEATDTYLNRLESFVGGNLPYALAGSRKVARQGADTSPAFVDAGRNGTAVIVAGRAGSGKSTFLAITRKRLQERSNGKRLILHVDLISRTQTHALNFNHDRLIDEVCSDLLVQAEERFSHLNPYDHELLREIFGAEIRRLTASLSSRAKGSEEADKRIDELIQNHLRDAQTHLKAYLGFLHRKDVAATIILDNVDRGTVEFERVTFQLAQTLARNTNATIVTSLRDSTYESGKKHGFLDVARHTVFTISPPSFVEVARRRFEYARKRLQGDPRLRRRFEHALAGHPSDRVYDFAEILSELVLGENKSIQTCIQALTGTNIRRALELLEHFSTSPNTDLNALFSAYRSAEMRRRIDYGPPLEAFLRSIMRMFSTRYEEEHSKVMNLFQVSRQVLSSHFTGIRILQFLSWRSSQERSSPDASLEDVIRHLGALVYGSADVISMMNALGRYGLVGSLSKAEPPWMRNDVVRLGAAGRYYLEELVFNREYIKNIVDDTIVYDEQLFATMDFLQNDRERPWPQRLDEKALAFLVYLGRREQEELGRIGVPSTWPPWLRPIADVIGTRYFGRRYRDARSRPSRGRSREA